MSNKSCHDQSPISHTEVTCHALGEKRQNLINKLKMFLDTADERPCLVKDGRQTSRRKPMIKYPGYVDYNHPAFKNQKLEDCLHPSQPKIMDNNYCKNGNHHEDVDQETSSCCQENFQNMKQESRDIDMYEASQTEHTSCNERVFH
ncbi:uncharacterized protein LOC120350022 [Nilaparvata lugens]|uniref:uncharacterized protein LOC120350022 n=1 Tax=Nilaparvata lugens TaxID=108931 RepID=UPI00193E01B5|nr:uncharacterized protein LOC120350022 [Nilaparvata lugens]